MDVPPIALAPVRATAPAAEAEAEMRAVAESFETTFLAEMLRLSGLNAMPAGFGGGAGEEAFGSLLTDEYARMLSERGGIGIAEQVFQLLLQRTRAS